MIKMSEKRHSDTRHAHGHPPPTFKLSGFSSGLGDRVLQCVMAATVAKLHNATVLFGWHVGSHADTHYGEHARHKGLRFNISATAYPWPITDYINFPPELRIVATSSAEWHNARRLPDLALMPSRPASVPATSPLSQLFEVRYQCNLIADCAYRLHALAGGPIHAKFPLKSFLAAYDEASRQFRLRERHAARLPPPPYLAVHARRGEKARSSGCRVAAGESAATCRAVAALSRAADVALNATLSRIQRSSSEPANGANAVSSSTPWYVASDDAALAAALRRRLGSSLAVAQLSEAHAPEPGGMDHLLEFFALAHASLIVQSVPAGDAAHAMWGGWTSYSFAASKVSPISGARLVAVAPKGSRLLALSEFIAPAKLRDVELDVYNVHV